MAGVDHQFMVYIGPNLPAEPPVILFLHGRGESGTDGEAQTTIGIGTALLTSPERWPFLVVFPQKPSFDVLWPGYTTMLSAVLDRVEAEFKPDPRRCYLTGISQGGNGTLELVDRLDWKFAAMAPICGWANPRDAASKIEHIPTWIFHGDADQAVPVTSTTAIADWCVRYGAKPRVTIYAGVDHNSWDAAYAEPLPEWFLEHTN